jgi:hypothetical protein
MWICCTAGLAYKENAKLESTKGSVEGNGELSLALGVSVVLQPMTVSADILPALYACVIPSAHTSFSVSMWL